MSKGCRRRDGGLGEERRGSRARAACGAGRGPGCRNSNGRTARTASWNNTTCCPCPCAHPRTPRRKKPGSLMCISYGDILTIGHFSLPHPISTRTVTGPFAPPPLLSLHFSSTAHPSSVLRRTLAISLMVLPYLPRVSGPTHDIVPELVPERQGREARTRELCDGGEVEAVRGAVYCIERYASKDECDERGGCEGGENQGGGHCGCWVRWRTVFSLCLFPLLFAP